MSLKRTPEARAPRATLAGIVLVSIAVGAACQRSGDPAPPAPDVWATVDGREIRRDDVEKAYRRMVQATPAPPSEDEVTAAKLGIVDELINQDILIGRAGPLQITITDAEIDAAFTERKGNMTDAAFQQELTGRKLTVDDMKQALRRELLAQKVIAQEIDSRVAISDQDIASFYDRNRARFNISEPQYRIAQIVITPVREPQLRNRRNDDAATPADAARKAQMLMERMKSGGDFAALAMDFSEDPQSAPNGGDLGFVSASQLNQVPAPLRNAVLRAEPGAVNLVSAGGGHTLVMLLAREPAGQRPLSAPEVRETISTGLRERKTQLLRAAYITAARNDAAVVNYFARQLVQAHAALPSLAPAAPGK